MNYKNITFIIIAISFFACNSNPSSSDKNHNNADSITPNVPPQIVKNDSVDHDNDDILGTTVTSFEMRDDSVFADGSIPAKWENAGITDVKGFKVFLKQLQLYVMDNDKPKLAAAIRYPLKNITNEQELIEHYDAVFTKPVKLSFATINFNQIFRNQNGAMTEGGKVWFAQVGKEFKIIAINP